jgi:hypothetical protein
MVHTGFPSSGLCSGGSSDPFFSPLCVLCSSALSSLLSCFYLLDPTACHPASPEPRRERSEGSAFLSSLSVPFSAYSANSVLRKTLARTPTAPSATLAYIRADFQSSMIALRSQSPFLATRLPRVSRGHSPLATIPFRITSFADPYHVTPTESYSYKKQGRGWGVLHPAQTIPLFSTASKHPTHRNARNSCFFLGLLYSSLDIRGGGIWLSLRGSAHSAPLRYPFPLFASPPWLNTRGPR